MVSSNAGRALSRVRLAVCALAVVLRAECSAGEAASPSRPSASPVKLTISAAPSYLAREPIYISVTIENVSAVPERVHDLSSGFAGRDVLDFAVQRPTVDKTPRARPRPVPAQGARLRDIVELPPGARMIGEFYLAKYDLTILSGQYQVRGLYRPPAGPEAMPPAQSEAIRFEVRAVTGRDQRLIEECLSHMGHPLVPFVYDSNTSLYYKTMDAEKKYRRAVEDFPDAAMTKYLAFYLARYYHRYNRHAEAIKLLEDIVLAAAPFALSDDALMVQAQCYQRLGKKEEARQTIGKLLTDFPSGNCARLTPEFHPLLLELLKDHETPAPVRAACIAAAAESGALGCTPILVSLLDDEGSADPEAEADVRLCDLAAAALERMHRINYTGIAELYQSGPLEKRDAGIALWKAWHAAQGKTRLDRWREVYAGKLMGQTVTLLDGAPDRGERAIIKSRLRAALGTSFCLGDLPGVDAVVSPNVADLWRIMRVQGEKRWRILLSTWRGLERAYDAQFVPKATEAQWGPDRQALALILFARDITAFPKVWAWSFCRDFAEQFPASNLLKDVDQVKQELTATFREQNRQVVLHGRIAQLEPVLAPGGDGPSRPDDISFLQGRIAQQPSNWAYHCAVIDYCARQKISADYHPHLPDLVKLYPGNEWLCLAEAAYQMRVTKRRRSALEYADKAAILNPGNPKVYAVRGMAHLTVGRSKQVALDDLTKAFTLDPASLGNEPETVRAVTFLVEKTWRYRDKQKARGYVKTLAPLRAFGSQVPLKDNGAFKRLVEMTTPR